MHIPSAVIGCPPGLEYLSTLDCLYVEEQVDIIDLFIGFEQNNRYIIKNIYGEKIYWAVEDNDCCTRCMCGGARPFDMKVFDYRGVEVIHFRRPLRCQSCCFPCCLQVIEVFSPPGELLGTVEQNWTLCKPDYSVKNHNGETVLRITGPICMLPMCCDVEFKILSLDGQQVGRISKNLNIVGDWLLNVHFFGISFPLDLDVRMKAVMLGACMLIDMMYMQRRDRQGCNSGRS
ncbi:phospholipid scramblase 2-like isoform X2 [Sitodiplosis mosellana]|nr:phospholipid scramblase 2-like isoform X2 [Sitodiplosis mosellana]